MGLVMVWARVAALAPRLASFLSHAPGLASLAKLVAGIAPAREVPRFAPYTFRRWFGARPPVNRGGRPVLLFVDTFSEHFQEPLPSPCGDGARRGAPGAGADGPRAHAARYRVLERHRDRLASSRPRAAVAPPGEPRPARARAARSPGHDRHRPGAPVRGRASIHSACAGREAAAFRVDRAGALQHGACAAPLGSGGNRLAVPGRRSPWRRRCISRNEPSVSSLVAAVKA